MGKEDAILIEMSGVIIPPPEIKKIIDKAAGLVAKYGSNIEAMMRNEDKNLPKFSFLKEGDPYRSYYDYKVNELAKNSDKKETIILGKKTEIQKEINIEVINDVKEERKKFLLKDNIKKIIEDISKTNLDKTLPQDQFTIIHPNISPLEMDIIKTTAQYVARNGQRFLTGLSEREAKNNQFDFLKPQHTLFGYFTHLVEQYSKCLLQRKEDITKLTNYANDKQTILKRIAERYLIDKKIKENQKKKHEIDENEKNQMMQIDWNDFVILETIEFTEEELKNTVPIIGETFVNENISSYESNVNLLLEKEKNIPEPINITQFSQETNKIIHTHFEEVKIDMPIEDKKQHIIIENIQQKKEKIIAPEPGMKIVKNYVRKTETQSKNLSKCPLCNEYINVDDLINHMKIELLDPKWKDINQELIERKNFSATDPQDFLNNLHEFSKNRPDLFGDISDVIEKEEVRVDTGSGLIWSGFAPNMTRTSANIAMLNVQNRKNIEESRKLREGIIPNLNIIQPNPKQVDKQTTNIPIKIPIMNKKEEKGLVPEDVWIKKHPNNLTLNVKVPESGNEFFKGQIITISHNPKDKVLNIKQNLSHKLNEFPIEEFILRTYSGAEIVNDNSIAFYNINNNDFLEIELKKE